MNRPDRSAATNRRASRIGSRMARSYASVNDFLRHAIMANECVQERQTCSVGDSPTGGKVRNLRSLGRIRGGNEADEADRPSHLRDGERVTGPQHVNPVVASIN